MHSDFEIDLHTIYRETLTRLEIFERRVEENQDVMAASEFCRWLNFSRILNLLECNPQGEPLKVDGFLLRWRVGELLRACNDRFAHDDKHARVSEVATLHEKIDLIAGYLSRLVPVPAVRGEAAPRLIVIPGGCDAGRVEAEEQERSVKAV